MYTKFSLLKMEKIIHCNTSSSSIIEIYNPTELHFSALKCRLCTFELSCSLKKLTISYITCSSFTESNIQEPNHFETNSLERLIASIADFINAVSRVHNNGLYRSGLDPLSALKIVMCFYFANATSICFFSFTQSRR